MSVSLEERLRDALKGQKDLKQEVRVSRICRCCCVVGDGGCGTAAAGVEDGTQAGRGASARTGRGTDAP
jgi:hypothetical protein